MKFKKLAFENRLSKENFEKSAKIMDEDTFIFCLEAVDDIGSETNSETLINLEKLALGQGINSIYKSCDSIEGLEESLNQLLYNDHNFKSYEIIYLIVKGEGDNICIADYYYSLQEIAELFEGKMTGKIVHFANEKVLDLSAEEAQYFLDVTGARAISGYGSDFNTITSSNLDRIFFSLFADNDNLTAIVEELLERQYALCKLLDFRLYH